MSCDVVEPFRRLSDAQVTTAVCLWALAIHALRIYERVPGQMANGRRANRAVCSKYDVVLCAEVVQLLLIEHGMALDLCTLLLESFSIADMSPAGYVGERCSCRGCAVFARC